MSRLISRRTIYTRKTPGTSFSSIAPVGVVPEINPRRRFPFSFSGRRRLRGEAAAAGGRARDEIGSNARGDEAVFIPFVVLFADLLDATPGYPGVCYDPRSSSPTSPDYETNRCAWYSRVSVTCLQVIRSTQNRTVLFRFSERITRTNYCSTKRYRDYLAVHFTPTTVVIANDIIRTACRQNSYATTRRFKKVPRQIRSRRVVIDYLETRIVFTFSLIVRIGIRPKIRFALNARYFCAKRHVSSVYCYRRVQIKRTTNARITFRVQLGVKTRP